MKKENKVLFYFLSFTWGLLWTIIGLLAFLFVLPFTNENRCVKIYRGRLVIHFKKANFGGASLGLVIFTSSMRKSLLNHEVGHSIQNIYFGPLFPFLVAIPSGIRYQLFDWLDTRHRNKYNERLDYDRAWFEGQATKLGNKHLY